jgi:predicted transcriptional regulator
MGLLNVIKLANDYNTAKKILKGKNINKVELRKILASIREIQDRLDAIKDIVEERISKTKNMIKELLKKVK